MGDVGQTADSAATLQHLAASASQSILDTGDLSYAGALCMLGLLSSQPALGAVNLTKDGRRWFPAALGQLRPPGAAPDGLHPSHAH